MEKIPNFLKKRADLTPNRIGIVFEVKEYTFHELYELSYQTAQKLAFQGIKENQFVGVLLSNHIDTVVILYSLHLLGVKGVILNTRLSPDELSWQLHDSNSQYLISEQRFHEKIRSVKEKFHSPIILKEELVNSSKTSIEINEEVNLDDICTIMYTSGTTGNPKGVIQTFGNHWWSAVGSALNLGLKEEDCWLCNVPLFHISGYSILMRSLIYGMKVVLHEKFHEDRVIHDIHENKVTIMSVVATTLRRILSTLGDQSLPTYFRCMLLGGGPAPMELLEQCVKKNIPVYQTYGLTETSSQIVTLSPEYSLSKLGSAGKPLFPAQIKIVNNAGELAEPYESGEIFVKGPNVTKGYLNREDERRDGWFGTGDIGYVDQEGFLYVQDRRSDLIISGGENVYPAEIEAILTSLDAIVDAGVVGKKDVEWGEVPVAFVVTEKDVRKEELFAYCQKRLAKYKIPKEFYFVNELPRNASNKLLRRKLKEWLIEYENMKE